MTRLLTGLATFGTVAVLVLTGTGRAAAQAPAGRPGPTLSPPISPYLNLLRRGGSTAQNYYNLVRPQQQLYGGVNNLQRQVTNNRDTLTAALSATDPNLPATGHAASFLNYGGYFQNLSAAGAATGVTGGAGGATRSGPRQPARPAAGGRTAPRQ